MVTGSYNHRKTIGSNGHETKTIVKPLVQMVVRPTNHWPTSADVSVSCRSNLFFAPSSPLIPFSTSPIFTKPAAFLPRRAAADLERRYFTETASSEASHKMQKLLLQIWHKFKLIIIGANTTPNSCRTGGDIFEEDCRNIYKVRKFNCAAAQRWSGLAGPKLPNDKKI